MISGDHWSESEFLKQAVEECKKWAKEDIVFYKGKEEDSFKTCMKPKIGKWTWVKEEQRRILEQILEE